VNDIKKISIIAMQVASSAFIMWLSGRVSFPLPTISVPITLQSMFPILLPLVFNSRYASGGILLWLLFGALGLPVFADGGGGNEYFYSNSGGYLLGFYLISILTPKIGKLRIKNRYLRNTGLFILMQIVLTLIGLLWIWLGDYSVIQFSTHVLPYLPGLVLKSLLGSFLLELFFRLNIRTYFEK